MRSPPRPGESRVLCGRGPKSILVRRYMYAGALSTVSDRVGESGAHWMGQDMHDSGEPVGGLGRHSRGPGGPSCGQVRHSVPPFVLAALTIFAGIPSRLISKRYILHSHQPFYLIRARSGWVLCGFSRPRDRLMPVRSLSDV